MNAHPPQYAVGRWESLWASHPYMSHRILIDLHARRVVAGEHRYFEACQHTTIADLAYVQQTLEETFSDIFDAPDAYEFDVVAEPPLWALKAWPWPRVAALTDDDPD